MQQVLNTAERSFTFWKFLLFFVITIVLIVTAVYFDFRMPVEENKKLKEKSFYYANMTASQERIANKAESIEAIMDSVTKGSGDAEMMYIKYSKEVNELNELNTQFEQGKYANGRINRILVRLFTDLKNKDKRITEITAEHNKKVEQIKDLENKIRDIKDGVGQPVSNTN